MQGGVGRMESVGSPWKAAAGRAIPKAEPGRKEAKGSPCVGLALPPQAAAAAGI